MTAPIVASRTKALLSWLMGLPFVLNRSCSRPCSSQRLEAMMSKAGDPSAPFSYEGLDRVIHEKARLGLMTLLVAHSKGLAFGDLRTLCGLTDGNLSRHLQVLAEAGFVEIIKGYDRNRPLTTCRLTALGRQRFLDYIGVLERVVRDAAVADEPAKERASPAPRRHQLKPAS